MRRTFITQKYMLSYHEVYFAGINYCCIERTMKLNSFNGWILIIQLGDIAHNYSNVIGVMKVEFNCENILSILFKFQK